MSASWITDESGMRGMSDLLLRSVRPYGRDGDPVDVLVRDGTIARIEAGLEAPSVETFDGQGDLVLPGLVDAHAHIDETLWGQPWRPHSAGDGLASLIENERRYRPGLPPVAPRAESLLRDYIANGTSAVRSHVDVDPDVGLSGIDGVCAARDAVRDAIDVQLVAFPQAGLLTRPGTAGLLEDALRQGVEVVGGIDPGGYDADAVGHLDCIFGLADSYGAMLDLHLHDSGELGAWEAELVIERTRALGLDGRVTISHAFFLGTVPESRARALLEQIAAAQISLATVAPGTSPVPPLRLCEELGIAVGLGCDGIRDLWSPFGVPDVLERAMLLAWRSGFRRDEDLRLALEAATSGGARIMGLDRYGLEPGCLADLVLMPAESPGDALMRRAPRSLVLKRGRIVAGGKR
jgi:cytosine deaminase